MTLHEAIQLLSIHFPNQGGQGIEIPTIGGRPGRFFRVYYYANGQHIRLKLESHTGNISEVITENVWNTVYARYEALRIPYKTRTTSYGNNWNNRPKGINIFVAPYVAGLIHWLTQHQ